MSNVAFLLANDFEDSEMKVPYDEIIKAGHQADIIGLKKGRPCWVKERSLLRSRQGDRRCSSK